jgi:hypothetical protein
MQDAWAAGNTGDALMHALHSAVFNDAVQEVTSCARAHIRERAGLIACAGMHMHTHVTHAHTRTRTHAPARTLTHARTPISLSSASIG